MARLNFLTRLKRAWLASKRRGLSGFISGFTLIELLVSMIIAAIITVSLLSLVVGLVDVNKRDAEQTEVQQSMQAAMDYIAEELRESIFVYDQQCLVGQGNKTNPTSASDCPGLVNHIPAGGKDNIVLAFWRTNLLPQSVRDTCKANIADLAADPVKNTPCLAGRGYTLVVYTLKKNDPPDPIWRGKARLERYQLPQFNAAGAPVTGYVDPLNSAEIGDLRFSHWPYQKEKDTAVLSNKQAGVPVDTSAVLVDFLDDKTPPSAPTCPDPSHPTYNSDAAGIYACVRGRVHYVASKDPDEKLRQEAEQGVKQEIVVNLTGAVPDKPKLLIGLGSAADKKLAPLQTRVLSRSILR